MAILRYQKTQQSEPVMEYGFVCSPAESAIIANTHIPLFNNQQTFLTDLAKKYPADTHNIVISAELTIKVYKYAKTD